MHLPRGGIARLTIFVGAGFGSGGSQVVNVRATLARDAPPTREMINRLRRTIRVTGATIIDRPFSSLFFFRMPDPISIDVRGLDLETGNAAARQLRGVLETVPGVVDLQMSREESAEEFSLRMDPVKASAFGTTAAQVAAAVRTYVGVPRPRCSASAATTSAWSCGCGRRTEPRRIP